MWDYACPEKWLVEGENDGFAPALEHTIRFFAATGGFYREKRPMSFMMSTNRDRRVR